MGDTIGFERAVDAALAGKAIFAGALLPTSA